MRGSSVFVAMLIGIAAGATQAQIGFQEVGASRGIQSFNAAFGMGTGVAAADYDGDGDIDFFVPHALNDADLLYVNDGTGTFSHHQITGASATANSRAALWFDFDNDQDLDLIVVRDRWQISNPPPTTTFSLFRQDGPLTFVDVTASSGLDLHAPASNNTHVGGICAGDIDNDDDIDLFVCFWNTTTLEQPRLFANNGDGTFSDMSVSSGIGLQQVTSNWQPMMIDLNGDGWQDIYQAIDFEPNELWINQGNSTFLERASQNRLANSMNDMGLTIADFDRDNDLDIYITNIHTIGRHNVLMQNNDPLPFDEISQAAGVDNGRWGWGTTFFDCNNDGWMDIAATNGYFNNEWIVDPSKFFLNTGSGPDWFLDVSDSVQFNDTLWGSCVIAADIDRDGDQDLLQTTMNGPFRVLENTPGQTAHQNHWITILPRMHSGNHRAIGAIIEVEADGFTTRRLISAGTSFLGQEPAEAHFGLGTSLTADRITIRWPNRNPTTFEGIAADQIITLMPPCPPGDTDFNGTVDINDLNRILGNWGQTGLLSADSNGDGTIDFADLNAVLGNFGSSCDP